MTNMEATDWELCYLGVHAAGYKVQFNTAGTAYKYAAIGVGIDPLEAMRDCLSQAVGQGADVNSIETGIFDCYPDYKSKAAIKRARVRRGRYHFVGLRWTDTQKPHSSWGQPVPEN